MPLTPEDVQHKEFTTVRLREGYDMQEVDNFLDEVEAELIRLHGENDDLRSRMDTVTREGGAATSAEPVTGVPPEAEAADEAGDEAGAVDDAAAGAPPVPVYAAAAAAPPHEAAAKVLALAQRTADELVSDARAEADKMVSESRTRSEQLDADTQMRAAELEKQHRERVAALEREHSESRSKMLTELQTEQTKLEHEVENLRSFEREYHSRLKAYLEGQLRNLESGLSDQQATDSLPTDVPQA